MELVTRKKNFYKHFWVSNSKCDVILRNWVSQFDFVTWEFQASNYLSIKLFSCWKINQLLLLVVLFELCDVHLVLSNSAPTPTHLHPLPPAQNNVPPTLTHPEELPIHPNPTPHTQNKPHPPPRTQNKPQLLKIMPRHHHSHKIWSNTTHLLKLLFDQDVTYGRHIIKVNFNFHGHIYTFTKCMIVC